MKTILKALTTACIAVALLSGALSSCSDDDKPVSVVSVTLSKTTLSITEGESESLTATIAPSEADNKKVTWQSDNTAVATVDATGKVTAVAPGTATITVTTDDGKKIATCKVTVTAKAVAVTGVTLSETAITLTTGNSQTLTAIVAPAEATNKNVAWASNNAAVATVDENGKVTAVAAGTATITAATEDGGKTASCTVTVTALPVITAHPASVTIGAGETATFSVTATGDGLTYQWEYSKDGGITFMATVNNVYYSGVTTQELTVTDFMSAGIPNGNQFRCVVTNAEGSVTSKAATLTLPLTEVTINGVKWATRNVGEPGTFAASPEDRGMYYQWNRRTGWSSTNPLTSSPAGQTWDDTSATGDSWAESNDPSPAGWRVPTEAELAKLFDAAKVDNEYLKQNGKYGRKFTDKTTGESVFFPVGGFRTKDGTQYREGNAGYYWSSSDREGHAHCMFFDSNEASMAHSTRYSCYTVRCVRK